MGEARRRKQLDPNYGRSGLVIAPLDSIPNLIDEGERIVLRNYADRNLQAIGTTILNQQFIVEIREVHGCLCPEAKEIKELLHSVGATHESLGLTQDEFRRLNVAPLYFSDSKGNSFQEIYGFLLVNARFSQSLALYKTAPPELSEWLQSEESHPTIMNLCTIFVTASALPDVPEKVFNQVP